MGFWDTLFLNDTLGDYAITLLTTVILFAAALIFQRFLLKRCAIIIRKTNTYVGELILQIIESLGLRFYLFIAFFSAQHFILTLPNAVDSIFTTIFILWVGYRIVIALSIIVDFFIDSWITKLKDRRAGLALALPVLRTLVKICLWVIIIIILLANLEVEVTPLIAGLGIGGLAFAFAFQKILADLFSAFVIFFDKPFSVGDFITIKGNSGTISRIGLKTTHIRLSTGEELIIPNQDMVTTEVINEDRLQERRNTIVVPVSYETSSAVLKEIPTILTDIVKQCEHTRIRRVYLEKLDEYAILFEATFYITTPDYSVYKTLQGKILTLILEEFKKRKIKTGYPIAAHRRGAGGAR